MVAGGEEGAVLNPYGFHLLRRNRGTRPRRAIVDRLEQAFLETAGVPASRFCWIERERVHARHAKAALDSRPGDAVRRPERGISGERVLPRMPARKLAGNGVSWVAG